MTDPWPGVTKVKKKSSLRTIITIAIIVAATVMLVKNFGLPT